MSGEWRSYRSGGIATSIIMLAQMAQMAGGMFGAGGLMGGESEAPSSATAVSGGPFTSGSVTIGKGGGIDTQTIIIIAAVALVALFLLKRK